MKQIATLEETIDAGETSLKRQKRTGDARANKTKTKLEEDRRKLAELKDGGSPSFGSLYRIAVGEFGRYDYNMVVVSVISPGDFLARWYRFDQVVWIRGLSTDGVVDGQEIRYEKPFWISGTSQYTAASGATRTVFVAEAIPEAEKKKQEPAAKK